jgi:DNA-binding transcriptional LysR family regulator
MRFIQLIYLAEIIEQGSISAAAKNLYISQSALSQSLAGLESELGVDLIHRSKFGVKPTYFGQRIYDDSKELIAAFNDCEARWNEMLRERPEVSGTVQIICTPGANDFLSDVVLEELQNAYPNIELIIRRSPEMQTDFQPFLSSGCSIGVGACVEPAQDWFRSEAEMNGFQCDFFSRETPMVVLSTRNPLAEKESLTKEDLKTLDVVYYSYSSAPWFLNLFRGTATRLPNKESIVKYVVGSDAAAVFTPSSIRKEYAALKRSLKLVPLDFEDTSIVPVLHYLIHRPEEELSQAERYTLQMIRFRPYS